MSAVSFFIFQCWRLGQSAVSETTAFDLGAFLWLVCAAPSMVGSSLPKYPAG